MEPFLKGQIWPLREVIPLEHTREEQSLLDFFAAQRCSLSKVRFFIFQFIISSLGFKSVWSGVFTLPNAYSILKQKRIKYLVLVLLPQLFVSLISRYSGLLVPKRPMIFGDLEVNLDQSFFQHSQRADTSA